MVIRPRIRAFLAALGLYALAALFIGYFGVNAYTGNRGILAKQNLDQRIADLKSELDAAQAFTLGRVALADAAPSRMPAMEHRAQVRTGNLVRYGNRSRKAA